MQLEWIYDLGKSYRSMIFTPDLSLVILQDNLTDVEFEVFQRTSGGLQYEYTIPKNHGSNRANLMVKNSSLLFIVSN